MTSQQKSCVRDKLNEIILTQEWYKKTMSRLRVELLLNAKNFDNYVEMYSFIKKNTPSLEDFCLDMLDAREMTGL